MLVLFDSRVHSFLFPSGSFYRLCSGFTLTYNTAGYFLEHTLNRGFSLFSFFQQQNYPFQHSRRQHYNQNPIEYQKSNYTCHAHYPTRIYTAYLSFLLFQPVLYRVICDILCRIYAPHNFFLSGNDPVFSILLHHFIHSFLFSCNYHIICCFFISVISCYQFPLYASMELLYKSITIYMSILYISM